ncbi:MAG: hypothetical protein AB1716_04080 [Planctomycetota bacterium]
MNGRAKSNSAPLVFAAVACLLALAVLAALVLPDRRVPTLVQAGPEPVRLADVLRPSGDLKLVDKVGRSATVPWPEDSAKLSGLLRAELQPYQVTPTKARFHHDHSPYIAIEQDGARVAAVHPQGSYDAIVYIFGTAGANTYVARGQDDLGFWGAFRELVRTGVSSSGPSP